MSASTGPANSPAVHARGLTVQIDELTLLAPTTLTLDTGASLVVTGANGAGKTTLLRVLAGTLAPSAGEVHVLGDVPDER
ncbi:MAG: ATP-binding cassette domain-containing protein, partial [Actinomycetales bacterium]|nr:ATP-binding cassette domain-containing protein [Actinomycetales bacterium]